MSNNSKINYKTYPVTTTAPDGVVLKAEIKYWAKDYTIYMIEPSKLEIGCGHLQYAVPAVYATDEKPRVKIHYIDLIKVAKNKLIEQYMKS